jgi:hypothetical protein
MLPEARWWLSHVQGEASAGLPSNILRLKKLKTVSVREIFRLEMMIRETGVIWVFSDYINRDKRRW